jgi:hypothetical protein
VVSNLLSEDGGSSVSFLFASHGVRTLGLTLLERGL